MSVYKALIMPIANLEFVGQKASQSHIKRQKDIAQIPQLGVKIFDLNPDLSGATAKDE